MKRDFFDEDLRKQDADDGPEEREGVPVQAISTAGLSRMVRQREELNQQVTGAVKEIEELRLRQEQLEKERAELEALTRLQETYRDGKQEIIQKLQKSVVLLEKEEAQASRLAEVLSVMRGRFNETLGELRGIDESQWSEDHFADDLHRSLVLVEDAQKVYRKGLAKIDAERWPSGSGEAQAASIAEQMPRLDGVPRNFGFWLKAGAAFALPIGLILVLLFLAWLAVTGWV
ncbi:MAG: hypothetical protein JW951_05640 [Lentisphaerae bacterium]|nr:hypothetical protein [Lentisphaerota bacterium]